LYAIIVANRLGSAPVSSVACGLDAQPDNSKTVPSSKTADIRNRFIAITCLIINYLRHLYAP
jgi:hypothetical protein